MWLEDRWTLVRRMYGDECTQKLFMRCFTWNLTNNDIKEFLLRSRQDCLVTHVFGQYPPDWFKKYSQDTWIEFWDGSCQGYISQTTLYHLSKKVNILGPIAAVFGRDLEYKICTHEGYYDDCIPAEAIQQSIENHNGTLSKDSFENTSTWDNSWTRSSGQSSGSYY